MAATLKHRWSEARRPSVHYLSGLLMAAALSLLPLRAAQAQGGYPPEWARKMQARISSLSILVQRLETQLAAERQMRARQQQQTVATVRRLERLHTAVNAAAAAGDPTARAVRSDNVQAVLQRLADQFVVRAGAAPKGTAAASEKAAAAPGDSGVRLSGAVMQRVNLASANLKGADLTNADLTDAVLVGANLRAARLQVAVLTGADLTNAVLAGAQYNEKTR